MPTTIESLIKPVTDAARAAAKEVQGLTKSVRHDIKRRNFNRGVSLKSVKAIKPAIAEPPRQDMDDAEIALMNEVRGCLNGLTTRRSPDTDPEALANHERGLCGKLDDLIEFTQEKAGKKGLLPAAMLKQALKDATSDLRTDQLRLLRVRAVELYGSSGKHLGKEAGPNDGTIRARLLALRLLIDTCNDRIIAKGYRSAFLGPNARTKEEKAIDSFIAAPLYGDTLVGPSRDLVAAIKAGAKPDQVRKLIEKLASGYKTFGVGLLFRALFDAFQENMPDASCEKLMGLIGHRAKALLEGYDPHVDRDAHLDGWLMLKVHNAYYSARDGHVQARAGEAKVAETEEFEPMPGQVRLVIDRAFSAIRRRDWDAAYKDLKALSSLDWSTSTIAETARQVFGEMNREGRVAMSGKRLSYATALMVAVANHPVADEMKRQHAVQIAATMRVLDVAYRAFARSHFHVAVDTEVEIADADIQDCLTVLNDEAAGTRREFQIPLPVRIEAAFPLVFRDVATRRHDPRGEVLPLAEAPPASLERSRGREMNEEALASLLADMGGELDEPVVVDRDRLIRDLDEMDEELAALDAEFAADAEPVVAGRDRLIRDLDEMDEELAALGAEFAAGVEPFVDSRDRLIRDLDEMDEELATLGAGFAAGNEPQQLPGGEDLERAAASHAAQSGWVPAEPAGRAPRVPNAKRIDPNRPAPHWMRGGNRLANRDNEEHTIEALSAGLGPEVSAEEIDAHIIAQERDAFIAKETDGFVYQRTSLDSDIEARAKRSSLTIDDLITSLDSPEESPASNDQKAVATGARFVQAVNNLNISEFFQALHAIEQVNEVAVRDALYLKIRSMTFDQQSQRFAVRRLNNLMEGIHQNAAKDKDLDSVQFGRLYGTWLALKIVNPALDSSEEQSVSKTDLRVAKDALRDLRGTPQPPDSIDPNTPTTSPRSVGWTRPESPRRNLEELSAALVASILGKDFGQALRTLHELDRLDVTVGQMTKLVGDSFRSSQTNPTVANVGKFSAIVDDLVILSRGDLSTAIADKKSALQLQATADRMATLWNHLKRDPSISGVKKSKTSKKERKAAIEVVRGLDPVDKPPAHDRPKLLKKPSRPGTKPALRTPTSPASG